MTHALAPVRPITRPMPEPEPVAVSEDPAQRRDLILIERARGGDLAAFNDLVILYQDQLFALVVRMVPDRDQASDAVQEAFFSAFRNLAAFRGGSVKSWLNRICVNAAMDTQRARKRRPVQPYPELEDESWQPPTGEDADPERTAVLGERTRLLGEAMTLITAGPACGDRPLRRRGLRLRRDRRDDRRVARDRQIAHPSRSDRSARRPGRPDGAVPWRMTSSGQPDRPVEPSTTSPRLDREMDHSPMTADHASNPAHATHDLLLVAALADRDPTALTPEERRLASSQVADCRDCRELLADLRAIAEMVPAVAIPARSRDFRLTPEDARRLRPTGWRGFLAWVGSSRDTFTRPLAVGLTTLGIAGLLIGTVPGAFQFGSGATSLAPVGSEVQRNAAAGAPAASAAPPAPESTTALGAAGFSAASAAASAVTDAAAPAASSAPLAPAATGAAASESIKLGAQASSPSIATGLSPDQALGNIPESATNGAAAAGPDNASAADLSVRDNASGVSAILVVAATLTILGLGLFAIRWSARRLGDG